MRCPQAGLCTPRKADCLEESGTVRRAKSRRCCFRVVCGDPTANEVLCPHFESIGLGAPVGRKRAEEMGTHGNRGKDLRLFANVLRWRIWKMNRADAARESGTAWTSVRLRSDILEATVENCAGLAGRMAEVMEWEPVTRCAHSRREQESGSNTNVHEMKKHAPCNPLAPCSAPCKYATDHEYAPGHHLLRRPTFMDGTFDCEDSTSAA